MATRTTVYLDESLLEQVRRFVPSRGLSSLVSELLSERVRQLEQAEMEAAMREGYLATRNERQALNTDWQALDGPGGWPA
jgi:metal-responsive CopG/Arc/MetJ family transcriptional regulator